MAQDWETIVNMQAPFVPPIMKRPAPVLRNAPAPAMRPLPPMPLPPTQQLDPNQMQGLNQNLQNIYGTGTQGQPGINSPLTPNALEILRAIYRGQQ